MRRPKFGIAPIYLRVVSAQPGKAYDKPEFWAHENIKLDVFGVFGEDKEDRDGDVGNGRL